MRPSQARPRRHNLTLRQMMKLVVFGAVASASAVPMVRLTEIGAITWPFLALFEAVAIPLVLALVAFPLVHQSPLKDWLIRVLLLISVGSVLGAAIYSLAWASSGPPSLNVWASGMHVEFLWFVIAVTGAPFILLVRLVVPARQDKNQRSPTFKRAETKTG
jgi:hypothetical protein